MINREKRTIIIKIYLNILVYASLFAGFVFLLAPEYIWPSSYSPTYFGIMAFISAFLIILPKYVFHPDNECKQEALLLMQFAIATAFLLNDLGSLFFYQLHEYNIQYDKLLHLTSPFYLTIVLMSFMQVWQKLSLKKSRIRAAIMVAVGSIAWELLEFLSDQIFHSNAFGIDGKYILFDTSFDLIYDFIGIFIAVRASESKIFYQLIISEYCQGQEFVGTVKKPN